MSRIAQLVTRVKLRSCNRFICMHCCNMTHYDMAGALQVLGPMPTDSKLFA